MSRKTVVFKMPTADNARRDEAPGGAAPIDDQSPPVATRASELDEIATPSEPDRWVQSRDLDPAPNITTVTVATPFFASSAEWSANFDLAAERNLSQIVALSFAVPPMLGWFWFANAFGRYQRIFGERI